MVAAGKLTHSITFQKKGTTLDSLGEPNHETFTDILNVRAGILAQTPQERFMSGSDQAFRKTKFKIRYRSDIHEDMGITFEGWRYEIEGIEPAGRRNRETMIVMANRVQKL